VSNVPSAYVGMQSSTTVLREGNDEACMPRCYLPRFVELSGLDTRLASGLCAGRAQSTYCTVQRYWLMSLAPTNKDSVWLNEGKTLIR
jgi:hypothetical protein